MTLRRIQNHLFFVRFVRFVVFVNHL